MGATMQEEDGMATIVSVNISDKKGEIKTPVPSCKLVAGYGLEGDAHAGDWHRQVSLLAQESVDIMTAMGAKGLCPGIFAENLTTRGIELHTLPVGTKLTAGPCLLEVTQIGKECHAHCAIFKQVGSCVMPTRGIFARVLVGGIVTGDDEIAVRAKQDGG